MAKKAVAAGGGGRSKDSGGGKARASSARNQPRAVATRRRADEDDGSGTADMFLKILQSPLVADLLAVAATAALAALAEHGFSSRGAGDQRRAGRAVKAAGKAAAAAIGRRLATEVEEIRKVSKKSRAGAEA